MMFFIELKEEEEERKEKNVRTSHTPFQLYRIKRSSVLYHVVQAKKIMIRVNEFGNRKRTKTRTYFFSV